VSDVVVETDEIAEESEILESNEKQVFDDEYMEYFMPWTVEEQVGIWM